MALLEQYPKMDTIILGSLKTTSATEKVSGSIMMAEQKMEFGTRMSFRDQIIENKKIKFY